MGGWGGEDAENASCSLRNKKKKNETCVSAAATVFTRSAGAVEQRYGVQERFFSLGTVLECTNDAVRIGALKGPMQCRSDAVRIAPAGELMV